MVNLKEISLFGSQQHLWRKKDQTSFEKPLKALYTLKEAPTHWFDKMDACLYDMGSQNVSHDPYIYVKIANIVST